MLRESVTLPFTSVVSYHTNEYGCGVAKFGKLLAEKLGVPFVAADLSLKPEWGSYPLFSLKSSEIPTHRNQPLMRVFSMRCLDRYGVFWHDSGISAITAHADPAFFADPSLGSPGLWCPSLIMPRPKPVRLFSFGMAHKIQTEKYRRVRELLDAAGLSFHLRVSVGLHEGTSLSDATAHFDALRDILGAENVTVLGILSDDAVSEELHAADYVLAFFEHGLRANNTTVHAAFDHGCDVITNHDEHSPRQLFRGGRDITTMQRWPTLAPETGYSWDRLISEMAKVCAVSQSATA